MIGPQVAGLFHFLAQDDLAELIGYFQFRQVAKGELLWREGDESDYLVFVVRGRLEASKETEFKGKQVVIGLLTDGSIVGDIGMIDGRPRSVSIRALSDTALLSIDREAFDSLLASQPELGQQFLKSILYSVSDRLRHAEQRLTRIF